MINAPELLNAQHDVQAFDCERLSLNDWLKKRALKAQQNNSARTYVVCAPEGKVIGYYALSTGAIRHEDAPGRVKRNMPDPIPVILLGRLAVDQNHKGRGIGPSMLRDALLRAVAAAEVVGIRAVLTHALDERARSFYLKQGFYESPTSDLTLMISIDEIKRASVT